MKENTERKYIDPMEEWNETMETLLGKEKWGKLNYWQKTFEVANLQEWRKDNPHWIFQLIGLEMPNNVHDDLILYREVFSHERNKYRT